jgi:hypothetical protein
VVHLRLVHDAAADMRLAFHTAFSTKPTRQFPQGG